MGIKRRIRGVKTKIITNCDKKKNANLFINDIIKSI